MNRAASIRVCFSDVVEASAFAGLLSLDDIDVEQTSSCRCFHALQNQECDASLIHFSDFLSSGLFNALPFGILCLEPIESLSLFLAPDAPSSSVLYVQEELDLDPKLVLAGLQTIDTELSFTKCLKVRNQELEHLSLPGALIASESKVEPLLQPESFQRIDLNTAWKVADCPWSLKVWAVSPALEEQKRLYLQQMIEDSTRSAVLFAREWAENHNRGRDEASGHFGTKTLFSFDPNEQTFEPWFADRSSTIDRNMASPLLKSKEGSVDTMLLRASEGKRISVADALEIMHRASFADLTLAAKMLEARKNPESKVPLVPTRSVSCLKRGKLRKGDTPSFDARALRPHYRRTNAELLDLAKETQAVGAEFLELTMLYDHELGLDSYEQTIRTISNHTTLNVRAFSPADIIAVAESEKLSTVELLKRFHRCGLSGLIDSGGSEKAETTLNRSLSYPQMKVHQQANSFALTTKAALSFDSNTNWHQWLCALERFRFLHDDSVSFPWFSPLPQHEDITRERTYHPELSEQYLRVIALSRLFLDNFAHIRCSINSVGLSVSVYALECGASAFGELYLSAEGQDAWERAYRAVESNVPEHAAAFGYDCSLD